MSHITTPSSIDAAPESSRPFLHAVEQQLGVVPNLFRLLAISPAALEGYLGLNNALSKGKLNSQTRERIALAVAERNDCGYCLAAHNYLGTNLAKLSAEEININRRGSSLDAKAAAAVEFAVSIVEHRGKVSASEIAAVQSAGYSDAEIIEIVVHVALNTLTNYVNEALDTEIDFPAVATLQAA
tara:strand:+ start:776 stop:1327 length:552 start_codon:yes stop_codon:yes gene_type:complete